MLSLASFAQVKNQSTNKQTKEMKKVLIIGMNPHTVDFNNPELPPGLTIEMVEKGTTATIDRLKAAGYEAEAYLLNTDQTDYTEIIKLLKTKKQDGVVIGNGIRSIKVNFLLFEKIVNIVHEYAPEAKIIFNSLPTDTEEAIKRWL